MQKLSDKILSIVQKHKEYDESLALDELTSMESLGLIEDIWKLYSDCQLYNEIHVKNKVNSYVAYYLGITCCKPEGPFHIEKRRTYGRSGFPDVDMDFDYMRRSEVVEYLVKKYGHEHVGNIGTIQRLKTKAAVRRAIKVLDPTNSIHFDKYGAKIKNDTNENFALENEILKTLPTLMKRGDGSSIKSVSEACEEYPQFNEYMIKYPEVKRIAIAIEGTISGFGCHAAGLVVSPISLSRITPLHVTRKTGSEEEKKDRIIATQFSMEDVERMGLIKFDVLGLSTQTAVSWACKYIKEGKGVEINWKKVGLDDSDTLELLRSGKTNGCFQLESPGMKECLRLINIDSFDDLVIAIAMYRPGPKDYISEFAARKQGRISVYYPHPLLKKITERTQGIMIYQEQIMQVFMTLAGLTALDGYIFMKGCAKKKPSIIQGYKTRFFQGAKNQGVNQDVVHNIWNDLEKFAGYSFNKSHSVSYAYLSYKTAYLKAHFPTEFMAARLSVETFRRNFDGVEKYECDIVKNFGFEILEPSLNESKLHWVIVGERKLRKPMLVKGIGIKAAEEIVKHQPYHGNDILFSFAMKVGKAVNSKIIEAMKDIGFWQGIKKERLVRDFEQIKKDRRNLRGRSTQDIFS